MKKSVRHFLTAGVLALLAAAAFALPASANHSWGSYHWARTSNPFTVKLGDNLASIWKPYLSTASSDWSKSTVLDTTVVAGQSTSKRCSATTGRVEVCNDTYGQNGWLGVASISVSGSHITAGTVKLNDTYFNQAQYNTPAWRQMVTCQEVGHTFGLDHQDENFNNANLGTCMDYTNDPSTNQHPNQHDYDQLVTIYSHLDSTNTAFGTVPGEMLAALGSENQASWGLEIAKAANGGWSVFEKDFGNGNKVLTRVVWAR